MLLTLHFTQSTHTTSSESTGIWAPILGLCMLIAKTDKIYAREKRLANSMIQISKNKGQLPTIKISNGHPARKTLSTEGLHPLLFVFPFISKILRELSCRCVMGANYILCMWGTVKNLLMWQVHDMVTICNVDMRGERERERLSRGIWKSAEQRNKEVVWTWPSDWVWSRLGKVESGREWCR